MDKQVQFNIDDGQTFYCDEISILNNQQKFFFDFKNSSPRVDPRSNEFLPVALKHSVVLMDLGLAKVFSRLLTEHIAKFEKEHGKIPEPQVKAEEKSTVAIAEKTPEYFG
jgi:hypothetical protein